MSEVNGPGLVVGRFQPLHYGHAEYIEAAFKLCTHLYIGISNPDPGKYYESEADPHRSLPFANPFSYKFREKMVHGLMNDRRIHESEYHVVPIRMELPDDCRSQIPNDTTVFVTIYDEWGETKKRIFEDMGFKVQVLWTRRETITRGRIVRQNIKEYGEWQHLVPPSTYKVVQEWLAAGNVINGTATVKGVV